MQKNIMAKTYDPTAALERFRKKFTKRGARYDILGELRQSVYLTWGVSQHTAFWEAELLLAYKKGREDKEREIIINFVNQNGVELQHNPQMLSKVIAAARQSGEGESV